MPGRVQEPEGGGSEAWRSWVRQTKGLETLRREGHRNSVTIRGEEALGVSVQVWPGRREGSEEGSREAGQSWGWVTGV